MDGHLNRSSHGKPFVLALVLSCSFVQAADQPVARFESTNVLSRPEGYREWIFVGSSKGLRYEENIDKAGYPKTEKFNNVYLNPAAYREYAKTGKFPEGTVLVLEIFSAETKAEPGLQGSYPKERVALEAAVKDSKRFPEGWAYFSFTGKNIEIKDRAEPRPKESCYACHRTKAADDNVFTQFYPVLSSLRRK
ncbi:MAG: cytochrome P460 [Verrucomicrobia bacterium]|nr:cytochrome P460 [Verrucomicrobiota bacterium]